MTRAVLPHRRPCETFDFDFCGIGYSVGVGFHFDGGRLGPPGEVFITCHKREGDLAALARDAAISVSLALQHGCPFETLEHAMTRATDGSAGALIGAVLDQIRARGMAG